MIGLTFAAGIFIGVAIGIILASILSMLRNKRLMDVLLMEHVDEPVPVVNATDLVSKPAREGLRIDEARPCGVYAGRH